MSKSLTGLVTVNADDIYSNFYQDVSSQSIVYLNGLTSNVQQQIDSLKGSKGGGYFLVWAESANGYSTANSGFTWSYGASGTNATNTPLVLGFSCNLIRFAIRSSSIPTTSATVQILKNGVLYYQVTGITGTATSIDLSGSNLTFGPNDTISIATTAGSGGGLVRVSLSFSSNGIQGPQGQGLTYRGTYNSGTYYNPYDIVYYNGSSYINLLACSGIVPTNMTYWGMIAIQGSQGQKGDTGSRGPEGPQGPKGDTGDRGPKGDSGSIANIAEIAISVAEFLFTQAEFVAIQSQITALQGQVAVIEESIAEIDLKIQNQTASFEVTNFLGDVHVTNGVSNKISLYKTGDVECENFVASGSVQGSGLIAYTGGINSTGGDVTITDGDFKIHNSNIPAFEAVEMDTSGNLTVQGAINVKTGFVSNVTVDATGITTPSLTCGYGGLYTSTIGPNSIANSIIIGNPVTPGTITLWGYVNMPFNNFAIGPGGFINQF